MVATLISLLIGAVYGAISGYFGGWVDDAMMRTLDMIYALPILILIIILFALLEKSLWLLVVALGSISWFRTLRAAARNSCKFRVCRRISRASRRRVAPSPCDAPRPSRVARTKTPPLRETVPGHRSLCWIE